MLRNPGRDPVDVNHHWHSWHRPWRKGWPSDQVSIPEVNIWESCEQNETGEITDLVVQLYFWQAQILLWFQISIRGWGLVFQVFSLWLTFSFFNPKMCIKIDFESFLRISVTIFDGNHSLSEFYVMTCLCTFICMKIITNLTEAYNSTEVNPHVPNTFGAPMWRREWWLRTAKKYQEGDVNLFITTDCGFGYYRPYYESYQYLL